VLDHAVAAADAGLRNPAARGWQRPKNPLPRDGPWLDAPDSFEQDGDILLTPNTSNKWAAEINRVWGRGGSLGVVVRAAVTASRMASVASPMPAPSAAVSGGGYSCTDRLPVHTRERWVKRRTGLA
jgi:hypothetical protein